MKSVAILILASCIGMLFRQLGFAEANIITVYVLGVLVTSVVTRHRIYSLISSIVSVFVFNFFFTDPQFTLRAYDQGYRVTFLIMFLAALLTSTLAVKLKEHAKQSAKAAYRTKVLFDTNQFLQQAKDKNEIVSATASQLIKLLGKDIVFYLTKYEKLNEVRESKALCEAGKTGQDIVSFTPFFDPLEILRESHSLDKRHEIPNLLSEKYKLA